MAVEKARDVWDMKKAWLEREGVGEREGVTWDLLNIYEKAVSCEAAMRVLYLSCSP